MLAEDYEISSIKGFDMFPYTAHVETVALLTKKHKIVSRINIINCLTRYKKSKIF